MLRSIDQGRDLVAGPDMIRDTRRHRRGGPLPRESLGAVAPAGLRSLASAIRPFLGRHCGGSRLAADLATDPPEFDRSRVFDAGRRVRLALASGEIHHGLGELVRVSGHSGALRHNPVSVAVVPS
jgi:hypothetical protein